MNYYHVMEMNELIYIGKVAVFYVPIQKLDQEEYGLDGRTPRELFEEFLMDNYDAYTLEISNTQGFWRQHRQSQIFRDENARYEVSFEGRERVPPFVRFLSMMCHLLKEEAIYLTMGDTSYLVVPKEEHEVRAEISKRHQDRPV